MKNHLFAKFAALSLAASLPTTASADAKDAIIGAFVGAAINQSINNQRAKQQKTQTRTVVKRVPSAPSLNGQYSRAERIQIQAALNDRGYAVGVVDGVLGKKSRRGISLFQASIGEPQTGQLTPTQFVRLTQPGGQFATTQLVNNRLLVPNEVAMLQQSLLILGFYQGRVDGVNGPGTQGAAMAFLGANGMSPAQSTHVNTLVMASTRAGIPTPPYLVQEASAQMAAANASNPFGAPQGQGGFVQQPAPNGFGQPTTTTAGFGGQQPAANGFGQPAQGGQVILQQPNGAVQGNPVFGAPQQVPGQQVVPQQQLYQQQPGVAPAPQQQQFPQGGQQQGAMFASGNPNVQPQQVVPQQQQAPQSTLDVFSPGGAQVAATGGGAQQAIPVPQQQQTTTPTLLFTDPNATVASGTQQTGGTFVAPTNN